MLIVAGVDGTGSRDWLPVNRDYSHIKSFVQDATTLDYYKRFWHGPNALGTDSEKIKNEVYKWIEKRITVSEPTEVVLVGHSRGAAIMMDIARMLGKDSVKKEVKFMGLYDAVDRSNQLGSYFAEDPLINPSIVNTSTCYHAMRDPRMFSRTGFGNVGFFSSNSNGFKVKKFYTSHGGIGGALGLETLDGLDWLIGDTSTTPSTSWNRAVSYFKGEDARKTYVLFSIAADNWIRKGAIDAGVPLFISNRSKILNDILDDLIAPTKCGQALSRKVSNRIVNGNFGRTRVMIITVKIIFLKFSFRL